MSELTIRDAAETEAATVVALIHTSFEEYRGVLDPPSGAHDETQETVRAKMEKARFALARLDGIPVGCVMYENQGEWMYLGRLAVLPDRRRRGIGRALIEYVEARAREAGLKRTRLGERLTLTELRASYERQGYRVVERRAHPGYPEPTYAIMEKSL